MCSHLCVFSCLKMLTVWNLGGGGAIEWGVWYFSKSGNLGGVNYLKWWENYQKNGGTYSYLRESNKANLHLGQSLQLRMLLPVSLDHPGIQQINRFWRFKNTERASHWLCWKYNTIEMHHRPRAAWWFQSQNCWCKNRRAQNM